MDGASKRYTMRIWGITGTNGKTTTTWVLAEFLRASGRKCGYITTVEVDTGARRFSTGYTTPPLETLKGDAVEKVLRVLMQPETGVTLAQASGCAPANESCYDLDVVTSDEIVMAMKEAAENAVPMPNVPEMDVMWTVAGNLLTDVNMSGKDIRESADAAQQEALNLIESMH